MLERILQLLLCHLIGDYVLQNDFIATQKGENWYIMFVHCTLYLLSFYICFGLCWQLFAIYAVHLIVDPLKAKLGKINDMQDQILHYLALLLYLL